jgi:hypothetical protein
LNQLTTNDALPAPGIADVQVGFVFNPGDFVTIIDTGPPVTFDHAQLTDVPIVLEIPEPASLALAAYGAAFWRLRTWRTSRRRAAFRGRFSA